MKTKNYILNKTVLFILAVLITSTFLQAQIMVDNNTGVNADYSDLQTAIDAANPNDVIYVQPSATSYGDITIEKALTIVGRSHSEDSFKSSISNITITYNGSNTNIKGLDINSITLQGLDGTTSYSPILVNNINLEYNKISSININSIDYYNTTIGTHPGPGANNILVRGNIISSLSLYSVNNIITNNWILSTVYVNRPDSTVISNNIFISESPVYNSGAAIGNVLIQNCIFISKNNSPLYVSIPNAQLSNCLTYNYGAGSYGVDTNATNMILTNTLLNTDPLFTSITTNGSYIEYNKQDDYTLQTGSPAIGSGFNGEDIGIFGNGYVFNNIGNPAGIPTTTILTSTASVPQNGTLQINFKGTSH